MGSKVRRTGMTDCGANSHGISTEVLILTVLASIMPSVTFDFGAIPHGISAETL